MDMIKSYKKHRESKNLTTTTSGFQAKSRNLGRILAFSIIAFLFFGAVLGFLSYFKTPTVQAAPVEENISEQEVENEASAYAASLLGAWLSSTQNDFETLENLLPGAKESVAAKNPVEYKDLEIVSAATDDQKITTVTLSVSVKSTIAEGEEKKARWIPQWYKVSVIAEDKPIALGPPVPVEHPTAGKKKPDLAYRNTVENDKIKKTVEDFVKSYTTGEGDISRFTTPENTIESITPTIYTNSSIEEVLSVEKITGKEKEVRILAVAALESESGKRKTQYALTLAIRDGRWEVKSIENRPFIEVPEKEEL